MATDAIFLNCHRTRFQNPDYLPFHPQSKQGGMPQPVLGFKKILIQQVVVRDMAVDAGCRFPVGAVIPCGILR
jgi:hypothetical protein